MSMQGFVPKKNSTSNESISDVIGNKTDTTAGDSLYAKTASVRAEFVIPTTNAVTNVDMADVVGNKSDTTAGTSIYSKILVGNALQTIPTTNVATNTNARDVIGQKSDTRVGTSLYSKSVALNAYAFNQSRVYPTAAAGVTLVSTVVAWAQGAYTTVIPAAAITTSFALEAVLITSSTAAYAYELALYASATEIARIRRQGAAGLMDCYTPIHTPIQAANKLIRARLADGTNTTTAHIVMSLQYRRF